MASFFRKRWVFRSGVEICRMFHGTGFFTRDRKLIIGTGVLMSSLVTEMKTNVQRLSVQDPGRMTSSQLIRNASGATVIAALAMYTQTVNALVEVDDQYTEAVKRLTALLELNLHVLGSRHQEDKVWEHILAVRSEVAGHLQMKLELEVMYQSAERALSSAAEAAFIAGVEFSSSAGAERLSAGQAQVQIAQRLSSEAQKELTSMEAKVIVETMKHAEEQKKKEQGVEEISQVLPEEVKEPDQNELQGENNHENFNFYEEESKS